MVNKKLSSHIELASHISIYVKGFFLCSAGIMSTKEVGVKVSGLIFQHMVFINPLYGLARL